MTGLGHPLFRAHARSNLVLAALIAFATALMAGAFTVLIAAATQRYQPGAVALDDEGLRVSLMGWTLTLTLFTVPPSPDR